MFRREMYLTNKESPLKESDLYNNLMVLFHCVKMRKRKIWRWRFMDSPSYCLIVIFFSSFQIVVQNYTDITFSITNARKFTKFTKLEYLKYGIYFYK